VLQCYSVTVLRCYGVTVLRCYGVTVLRCYGASIVNRNTNNVPAQIEIVVAKGLIENGDNVTVIAPVSYEDFLELDFPTGTNFLALGTVYEGCADVHAKNMTDKNHVNIMTPP